MGLALAAATSVVGGAIIVAFAARVLGVTDAPMANLHSRADDLIAARGYATTFEASGLAIAIGFTLTIGIANSLVAGLLGVTFHARAIHGGAPAFMASGVAGAVAGACAILVASTSITGLPAWTLAILASLVPGVRPRCQADVPIAAARQDDETHAQSEEEKLSKRKGHESKP